MRIVHAASELYPYVKTGGLADAVAALAGSLAGFGHEVAIFLPGYRQVLDHPDCAAAPKVMTLGVEMDDIYLRGEVLALQVRENLTLYLVCRDEFFDRSFPYGKGGQDYEDNGERYLFFSKAIVDALGQLRFKPEIVHCHDWQTALVPLLLRVEERGRGAFLAGKSVLTIHNLAFQGVFPMRLFAATNLPDELQGVEGIEYYGQINFLKAGILFADRVTTVSPTYGKEIVTPEFGCGLEGVLALREHDLFCHLNGIDTEVWNPETDPYLPFHYNGEDLSGKVKCRRALLRKFGLKATARTPVYAMICRFTAQKGLDLLREVFSFFEKQDCRLIVLGGGNGDYEKWLRNCAERFPGKVGLRVGLDEELSHLIEAGADFFLMPSTFEPCGLNQLYSMRYGTIPLASRVGGLADTVIDLDADPEGGTGLSFPPTPEGFRDALDRSAALFRTRKQMRAIARRIMEIDHSWRNAARNYEALYYEMV